MKKSIYFFTLILHSAILIAQNNCNCDHYISNLSATNFNLINGNSFDYKPGDIFCIASGEYKGIRLVNFNGSQNNPLIFKNDGGKVIFSETTYPAIELKESTFIKFTGTGNTENKYGFIVTANTTAIGITEFSSDIEMDHIKVERAGFAGFMAKTNPRCNNPKTWRRNGFIMKNIKLHDNYIKDTEGEGFYIGSTDGYKVKTRLKCNDEYAFPHWLENIEIYNNSIENVGWDGIQVNLVRKNGQIYNNTITGYGTSTNNGYQKFAMSIGGGRYSVYNNYIKNLNDGKGMQFISTQSGTMIYNNVMINPKSDAIFIHSRHQLEDKTRAYYVLNNTIINPEKSGVKLYTHITESSNPNLLNTLQSSIPSYFVNNIIVNPGNNYETTGTWKNIDENYFDFNAPDEKNMLKKYISSNLLSKNIDTLGFSDSLNNNYTPKNSSSSMVDTGEDLVKFGITNDFNGISRPLNNAFDIGAYELKNVSNSLHVKSFKPESKIITTLYPNPTNNYIIINTFLKINSAIFYDIKGNFIEKKENPSNKISISNLKEGLYFIRINYENTTEVLQIIKK
ncbi:Por secretion system C-terminal sorting domain-containing protein [Tenacibaculum sp. MAR_2010_89]|uniref:T9SS type A sorting domain-containing protein n=1 Tax=Tenacibaculum sp. MAR_2010_89 TaxID=1250198 RepID=UPI0008999745|nr:T9SS type A sorting domain-containing protein [Tenacibaculum sp. MAR_2010_89]SEE57538.1 Por secretion system C-terminal sorting domain-containing protein [Tenacibaculum sp. MAR_2010_89]